MIPGEEGLDGSSLIAQAERDAVTGVAHSVVGPGEDDVAQCLKRSLKGFGRGGVPRTPFEDGVAHDHSVVVHNGEADDVIRVARSVIHSQAVLTHSYEVAVGQPPVDLSDRAPRMSHHGHLQASSHFLERADVVHMTVGDEDGDGITAGKHFQERIGLAGGVDENALPRGGADQDVGVRPPGSYCPSSQFHAHLLCGQHSVSRTSVAVIASLAQTAVQGKENQ